MKSRLLIIVVVCCASDLCVAQSLSPRAKRELVRRIDVKTERFQRSLSKELKPDLVVPVQAQELIQFAEDLSLLIDGLERRVIDRQYVAEILRVAFGVEQQILSGDVSSSVVIAWSALHAELDLLAKCYGVKWTDAVMTGELIAQLEKEVSSVEDDVRLQLPSISCVGITTVVANRQVAQRFEVSYTSALPLQVSDLSKRVRNLGPFFKDCSFGTRLQTDWRRLSTTSEELIRLLSLDSSDSIPTKLSQNSQR